MRKTVFFLLLLFIVPVSCDYEPLAQDLPSLQGTKWEYAETEVWEGGSHARKMLLHFWDDETVIYTYEYENIDGFKIETGSDQFKYIYRYDLSVKRGIFIYEEGGSASFEMRANLLLLTMGYDTYIFRRV